MKRNIKTMKTTIMLLGLFAVGSLGGHLQATIVSADFQESLDLPYESPGPRILRSLGQTLGPGFELAEVDQTTNPGGYRDSLQVDFNGTTLTLQATGINSYQTVTVTLANIVFSVPGEQISGFSILTNNAVVMNTGTFTGSISFTTNSLTVSYTIDNIPGGNDFKFASSTATSTFAVTTAVVPEPATGALALVGLFALAAGASRQRYLPDSENARK